MRERLIRFASSLYPVTWRRRYGDEFEALLEDTSRDWRDVFDVLAGALKMQITSWSVGRFAAVFGVAGTLLWSGLLFVMMPDQYTSDAVLRLWTSGSSPETPITDKADKFVIDLIQHAESRDSLASVIETHGLYERERQKKGIDDAIDRMRRSIRFDRIEHSNAFHVRFRYDDAKQAQRIEQELIRKVMEANVADRRAHVAGAGAYNMEVLKPASLPKRPSAPNRFLLASEGLAGGLLLGALTTIVLRTRPPTAPAGNSPKSS
jgi:uncharacterized protein involved in exopolysaccharide biosynthesis